MGLGFESQADHDDLYIRHNVRFLRTIRFRIVRFFVSVRYADYPPCVFACPLLVTWYVNHELPRDFLPSKFLCSMRNQRSPLPLLMQYGEGMSTVVRFFIVGAAFPKRAAAHPQTQECSAVLCSPQLSLSSCAG